MSVTYYVVVPYGRNEEGDPIKGRWPVDAVCRRDCLFT